MLSLEASIVMPRATVVPMNTQSLIFPTVDATSNVSSVFGGIVVYRTEEGAELTESSATFNSINSWALGLTHDFVIGVVAEGIGKGIPMAVMPCVNAAYVQHRQLERSIAELREMGVRVLYGEGGFVPNQPGQGKPKEYPWHLVLDEAERIATRRE